MLISKISEKMPLKINIKKEGIRNLKRNLFTHFYQGHTLKMPILIFPLDFHE